MIFNSYQFLVFFPFVTFIYYSIPFKARHIWLLVASYFFYMCWNPQYALLMALSTITTYISGILLSSSRLKEKSGKKYVALSFIINIAILIFFKYFYFSVESINTVLSLIGVSPLTVKFDIILPVGISFYTFQALSYTMDVYRGDIKPEKNILKYALFVSFFPQLVAGPIERSTNLLNQIREKHFFDYEQARIGLLRMLWGFFLKMVVADRISIIINPLFENYTDYNGAQLLLAIVLFAFQIYCDFGGYSEIAIGAAQVMGFRLMENFKQPYFSKSIQEFWRRWHISLSTWFKDYLYFPLGGSRVSKLRRYRNIMIVFLVSGLWHGASWNFLLWGGLHGVYQLIGDMSRENKSTLYNRVKGKFLNRLMSFLKIVTTFILVDIAWVFFRIKNFNDAVLFIKTIFIDALPSINLNSLTRLFPAGLDQLYFLTLVMAVLLIIVKDILDFRAVGGAINTLIKSKLVLRWSFYVLFILFILTFGIYGTEFTQTAFIYFQF